MATPMIDDIELKAVQVIRQETDQDFVEHKIAGLDGTLHQQLGRGSHRVFIRGVLLPATAEAELRKLQQKAAAGEVVTFSADITTALAISKMVIEQFRAEQRVGPAGQIAYEILLAESSTLPAAAEVTAFGGLDGVAGAAGNLGFDPAALDSVLEDVSSQAAAALEAADKVAAVIDQVNALRKIADLRNLGNPVRPLAETVSRMSAASKTLGDITRKFDAIPGAQP